MSKIIRRFLNISLDYICKLKEFMELIKLYMMGLVVLVLAILANFLAAQLGLKTWYDFLNQWGAGNALNFKDGL